MKKRLYFILAVFLTVSSLMSMNANAIAYPWISDTSDKFFELMENSTEITEYFDNNNGFTRYFFYNGSCLRLDDKGIVFDFTVPQNADIDSINEVLNSINYSYKVESFETDTEETKIKFSIIDKESKNETKKIAMELCDKLNSICDLQTFDYYGHIYYPEFSYFYSEEILCYPYKEDVYPEMPVVLRKYVEENLSEFEVVDEENSCEKWCTVKAKKPVTIEERFTAAAKIKEELGMTIVRIAPGSIENYTAEPIDMCNNINGDANCDGKYTIADSTAILQHLGNEDKYGLSLQGEFNADIYNVGDGVTPMDALEVQKVMASKG